MKPLDAFMDMQRIGEDFELWIINSSLGREEPSFCIKRWSHMVEDFSSEWPMHMDIKNSKQGVQRRPDANGENDQEKRGNSNCILRVWRP